MKGRCRARLAVLYECGCGWAFAERRRSARWSSTDALAREGGPSRPSLLRSLGEREEVEPWCGMDGKVLLLY